MEDTGSSSALNPATNVDYSLPSLTLTNQEGLEPVLPYTVFRDLYRGAEPLSAGDDDGFSTELRAHLNTFLNAVPNDSGTDYKSVRNPIDLMNEVIRSGQVDNFNEGRRLMVSSIRDNRAATYNTPANKALTRFSENNSDENTPPEDQAWIYTMLDWTYNSAIGKVFRAMQFVATSPDQVDASTPEIASAAWSGRYGKDFGSSGFNTPEYAATSLTGRTLGKVELLQEFIGFQKDALTLTGVSGITLNGSEPDCVKAVFQYNTSRVRVFISKDKQPKDPNHCGNQVNETPALEYAMVTIENRQY
ncbi:hypothetical protein [Marinobacter sp. LV10R510-11A]|uniref:hypothetical protein n=1 Tax=Marinobacter sp. LV10R510-11A TaxID=1415568 RepID=UPI000BB85CCC|nr:hypothetical protein [Marinobacter sp. LV10R510-11A]